MDEELLLSRAKEEREQIFQRYEKGRSEDNKIDPWEDPDITIYKKLDVYGFVQDDRFPQRIDRLSSDNRGIEIQVEREKKWLQMLKQSSKHWDPPNEKLKKRIYKGIPSKLRSSAWLRLLNVKTTIENNRGVYQNMLKLARQFSTETRQIDSDVNRQFREHHQFRERYSLKQQSLFNVLIAYSMYNMELGYCQGMAGVAGILLMYMDDEEAFWALSIFMSDRRYAMHGLFIEGFPKLTRFLAHHDSIISKFLPKLYKHFVKHNLDSILYSLKWFFVIFVERIPFSLCLRVWDIYMIEGERVVTAMAYTILRLHCKKLLKMKDMDLMTEFLQTQLHRDFGYDDDYVIRILEQSMLDLKRRKMDLPPPPMPHEFPKHPLGKFVEPNFESKIGLRKALFTDNERKTTEDVILRQELDAPDVVSNYSYDNNTDDNLPCLILEDSSSIFSSSIARTSIASNTNNNDWSEVSGADEDNLSCADVELNERIFLKAANEIIEAQRKIVESDD